MKRMRMLSLSSVVMALSACALSPAKRPAVEAEIDPILSEIAVHSAHVSAAVSSLLGQSAMNDGISAQVPPATFPMERLPPDLAARVDVEWHGEIEQAVEALASFIGWDFAVVGARPPAPIIVLLESEGESAGHLLRSVGQQGGSRANVIVRAPARRIELVYR